MPTFVEFVGKKDRETIKHLKLVKRLLQQEGFQVASHLSHHREDPYLYVYSPDSTIKFGLRVYGIGDELAYRLQRKEQTHPYGRAERLPIEEMWDDFKSDGAEDGKAAHKLIKAVGGELRAYFKESAKADKKARQLELDKQPLGGVDQVSVSGNSQYGTTFGTNQGR